MKNKLLPNNVTLAGLRRLRKALGKKVGEGLAIDISLNLWHYETGRISERIGVYYEGTGRGTQYFHSLKEAHDYVENIGKEK